MAKITIPKGATLWGLARKYNTTVDELLKLNPQITDKRTIFAGASLNVPDVSSQIIPESFKRLGITAPLGSPEATRQLIESSKKLLERGKKFLEPAAKEPELTTGKIPPSETTTPETPPVVTTQKQREEMDELGVTPDEIPEDQDFSDFLADIKKRFKKTDELISKITKLAGPTPEETRIQDDITDLENMLREDIQQVQERPLGGTVLKSAIANEIKNITQGNTRESLVLLRRIDNLRRKLQVLQGDRKAQLQALELEYDLRRQNINDAINFYKLTAPERIAIDKETGQVFFQNPITDEVYAVDIEGFEEPEEEKIGALREEIVGGFRVLRDEAGNIISTRAFTPSGGEGVNQILYDTAIQNLARVGLSPNIIDKNLNLTRSNADKIIAKGVPRDVVNLITQLIANGATLEQIRQALAQDFGRETGYKYLDLYMSTLQGEEDIENPFR